MLNKFPAPAPSTLPNRQETLRCLIVEDHVMFEQLLGALLQAESLVDVVAAAHSVKEGIEACRQHQPDLLLLDLALPDGDALAVARALVQCRPDARIIIISGQADTFRCPPDLKEHIYSVIDKTCTFAVARQELICCLQRISPTERMVNATETLPRLSPRETEIFQLIGRGLSTKEIAAAAFISTHTVQTHRKKIAAKLNLRATALNRFAILQKLTAASDGRDA